MNITDQLRRTMEAGTQPPLLDGVSEMYKKLPPLNRCLKGGVSREVCEPSLAFSKRCDLYCVVFHMMKIQSYLCKSVLVQKELSKPPLGGGAARPTPRWVATKRPDSSTSGGGVSAGPSVRVSPLWTKHESSPPGRAPGETNAGTLIS